MRTGPKFQDVFGQSLLELARADHRVVGITDHGAFDLAFLSCIPNLTVSAPRNAEELRLVMYTALSHNSGPFTIRYPSGHAPHCPDQAPIHPLLH
jgi:1-deoxy-D-xylulose-5-phosphate synthase